MSIFSIFNKKHQITDELKSKAIIIDVRTPAEFQSGHYQGSKNIPLQNLEQKINEIKKYQKPVIVCCASGMRSASACSILKKQGIETYDAGSWYNL
jgi:rhodanese-related sulfurtransferase